MLPTQSWEDIVHQYHCLILGNADSEGGRQTSESKNSMQHGQNVCNNIQVQVLIEINSSSKCELLVQGRPTNTIHQIRAQRFAATAKCYIEANRHLCNVWESVNVQKGCLIEAELPTCKALFWLHRWFLGTKNTYKKQSWLQNWLHSRGKLCFP